MKKPRLATIASIILPTLFLFVIGWLTYPWMLGTVIAGNDVTLGTTSIMGGLVDQLWVALSFALLGAVISGCFLLIKHKTSVRIASSIAACHILIALSSIAGWLFVIHENIAFAAQGFPEGILILEELSFHRTGIFASIAVFLATLLFMSIAWIVRKKRAPL